MPGTMFIIPPESSEADIEVRTVSQPPTLTTLQQLIGGYIEPVAGFAVYVSEAGPQPAVAFRSEEDKEHLPINLTATAMLWRTNDPHDYLVGTVVVLTGDDAFMAGR